MQFLYGIFLPEKFLFYTTFVQPGIIQRATLVTTIVGIIGKLSNGSTFCLPHQQSVKRRQLQCAGNCAATEMKVQHVYWQCVTEHHNQMNGEEKEEEENKVEAESRAKSDFNI